MRYLSNAVMVTQTRKHATPLVINVSNYEKRVNTLCVSSLCMYMNSQLGLSKHDRGALGNNKYHSKQNAAPEHARLT